MSVVSLGRQQVQALRDLVGETVTVEDSMHSDGVLLRGRSGLLVGALAGPPPTGPGSVDLGVQQQRLADVLRAEGLPLDVDVYSALVGGRPGVGVLTLDGRLIVSIRPLTCPECIDPVGFDWNSGKAADGLCPICRDELECA